MKKILFIGIILVIAVAGYLVYSPLGDNTSEPGESRVGFSIRDFLPFGKSDNNQTTDQVIEQNISTTTETTVANGVVPRLRMISKEPVAGAVIWNQGTTSIVRFVEKGTGNVYETRSDSNTVERLTNTTIPKIIRAFWLPNGSGFLAQTLATETEIIETSFVKLSKNDSSSVQEVLTPYTATISSLPTDIKELSVRPDGAKIFYYVVSGLNSEWHISNPDGTSDSVVYRHQLTEWLPTWTNNSLLNMQTKSTGTEDGFTYTFDINTRILKKNGTSAIGISSLPKENSEIFSSGGNNLNLFVKNKKDKSLKNLGLATISDKCVWSNNKIASVYCAVPRSIFNGTYPDDWYKGIVYFDDVLYHVTIDPLFYTNVINLSVATQKIIDVVDIKISPTNDYLIFRNKIDGYLWLLRISE